MTDLTKLEKIEQVPSLLQASQERPVVLFKHSLICPTSERAYQAFRRFLARREGDAALFALVEIQRARDVSKEIARLTGVQHESPQVILLRDGRPVWNASHLDITEQALEDALTA
ncbi:MAG: bacillithiol system redox-active protein YtxJ [Thermoanaerobaculia bacterium]